MLDKYNLVPSKHGNGYVDQNGHPVSINVADSWFYEGQDTPRFEPRLIHIIRIIFIILGGIICIVFVFMVLFWFFCLLYVISWNFSSRGTEGNSAVPSAT